MFNYIEGDRVLVKPSAYYWWTKPGVKYSVVKAGWNSIGESELIFIRVKRGSTVHSVRPEVLEHV